MRRCYKCREIKALTDFVTDRTKPLGHSYLCRACQRAARRAKYSTDASWRARKIADAGRLQRTAKGRARHKLTVTAYAARNPKKVAARVAVTTALRTGIMQKGPCEQCGARTVDAHHDDYDKPLTVRWLCRAHHKLWHREHGEGANAQPAESSAA